MADADAPGPTDGPHGGSRLARDAANAADSASVVDAADAADPADAANAASAANAANAAGAAGAAGPAVTAGVAARAWNRQRSWTWLALVLGLFAFLVHVVAGPGHLDDIDAINFTLGVRDFDVARHQPHPPGYALLIGAAKIVAGAALAASGLSSMVPAPWTAVPVETAALSLLAMLAGGLLIVALLPLARAAGGDGETALAAAVLAVACPLAFVTVSRPLSDAPGLAAALGVQGLLATAFVRQRGWRGREVPPAELAATGRLVVLAAFAAGLALGLRTQTAWLTLPLLIVVVADRAGRSAAAAIVGSAVTFTAGVLAWAIPLLIAAGGPTPYWHALTSQAGEDLEGVDMLLTSTRPAWRLAMNLLQTFVLPWGPLPLAIAVLVLAAIGVVVLLRRDRRGLVLLAGAVVPYAVFHLVWQENVTTRYALPIVPAIAMLAAIGLRGVGPASAGPWLLRGGAAALVAFCLAAGLPALRAYTGERAPVFRLFADMRTAAPPGMDRAAGGKTRAGQHPQAVVAMHRRAHADTRRVRGWIGSERFPWRLLDAPPGHEWLEMVRYWRDGGTARIWLLADVRRTDLALIDPASRHPNGHYAWSMPYAAGLLGGTRPGALDWVVIDGPPAWFLGQGWALSPEIAGVSATDGAGPSKGGATGWMRRSEAPRRLVIGGRNLAGPGGAAVRFTLQVGGRALDTWDVAATPGFFVRSVTLAGSTVAAGLSQAAASPPAASPLEPFVVTAAAADGSTRIVPAAIEQFGLQPLDVVQFAYAEGWHEDELQPRTGLRWRWSSGAASIQVWPVDRDVRIRLAAESPLKTFADPPIVTVTAGERELVRTTPGDAFTIDVIVPAAVLRAAGGRVVLRSSRTFVPAEHVAAGDPRHGDRRALGLRVFEAAVTDASRTP